MKTFPRITLRSVGACLLALSLLTCKREPPVPEFDPPAVLLSGDETAVIHFTASSDWTAAVLEGVTWLKLVKESGSAGESTITCRARERNREVGSREAVIRVTIGSDTYDITVTQAQTDLIMSDNMDFDFSFEAQEFSVHTRFNVDYQVSYPESWVTRVPTKAPLYEGQETFTVAENTEPEARKAQIIFFSPDHPGANLVLTLIQGGKDPILNITRPGFYGIEGVQYVQGEEGWNQLSRRKNANGLRQYRLLNAQTLSAVTVSGNPEQDPCTFHLQLIDRGYAELLQDYSATLLYAKDGLRWYKTDGETFFVLKEGAQ